MFGLDFHTIPTPELMTLLLQDMRIKDVKFTDTQDGTLSFTLVDDLDRHRILEIDLCGGAKYKDKAVMCSQLF